MQAIPDLLIAACGVIPLQGGLIAGLFLAGAAGSPLHCGPMCGGFVLGQVADRLAGIPAARLCERRRIVSAALIPYHLGRIVTYAALGAAAGLGGAAVGGSPYLTGALLMLAAGGFLVMAWRRRTGWTGGTMRAAGTSDEAAGRVSHAGNGVRSAPGRAPRVIVRHVSAPAGDPGVASPPPGTFRRTPSRNPLAAWPIHPSRGFPLGLMLGFLPCGFLYAALTAAAAGGDPLAGAAGMAAFGAGTMPALVAVGIAGHAAGRRWQAVIASIAPFVLVVNAALLMLLALKGLTA